MKLKILFIISFVPFALGVIAFQQDLSGAIPWLQYIPTVGGLSVVAASGDISEEPEMLMWGLVFVASTGGIALCGLSWPLSSSVRFKYYKLKLCKEVMLCP
jgi:hypothetical protein